VLVAGLWSSRGPSCFGNGVGWDGGIAKCGVRESGERNMGGVFVIGGMIEILMGDKGARCLLARFLRLLCLLSVWF
jgi:hypothetical protein